MMTQIDQLLSPGGPKFLTTAGIEFCLEHMFEDAEKQIVIVSPYIRMSLRLCSLLMEKRNAGIDVVIVHREDFEHAEAASRIFKRKNLHAKCFLTDKAVLVGSMNLYDYSQVNNDEMAIYFSREGNADLYTEVLKEVSRLCRDFPGWNTPLTSHENCDDRPERLIIGRKYARSELKSWFSFTDDRPGGIKLTSRGNIVLFYFSGSAYRNEEKDGIIYYMGHNTGSTVQKMVYGNKALYDSFMENRGRIFIFKDNVFLGECMVCMKPFQKDGKWIFPLKLQTMTRRQMKV